MVRWVLSNSDCRPFLTTDEKEKIAFLRIFLVIALVMLHFEGLYGTSVNPRDGYFGQEFTFASIIISFVCFIAYTAVPALSVISGYLFFMGADRRTPPRFAMKWRKRLSSLVLPFVIWGGLFATLGFLAARAGTGLFEARFLPGPDLWKAFLNAWIGYSANPLAGQLWFVRDLIVTVAVSPLIWIAIGYAPRVTLVSLCLLWLGDHNLWIFLRLDVCGFFALGAAFAMHGWSREIPRRLSWPLLTIFLVFVVARTVAPYFIGTTEGWGLYWATCFIRVFGVVTAWGSASLFMSRPVHGVVERYGYLAFFLHCAHYPPIIFVKAVFGKVIDPQNSLAHLLVYGLTVACTIAAVIISAYIMQSFSQGFFSVLSGGRTSPEIGRQQTVAA